MVLAGVWLILAESVGEALSSPVRPASMCRLEPAKFLSGFADEAVTVKAFQACHELHGK